MEFNSGFKGLNAELNPICYLLALLGAHHFLHVSGIRVNTKERVMAEAVNGRHVPAEVWACSQSSPSETCGSESDTGTTFSPYASVFPTSPSYYNCETDKQTKPGNLQTKLCCFGYRGSLNRKKKSFFYVLKYVHRTRQRPRHSPGLW